MIPPRLKAAARDGSASSAFGLLSALRLQSMSTWDQTGWWGTRFAVRASAFRRRKSPTPVRCLQQPHPERRAGLAGGKPSGLQAVESPKAACRRRKGAILPLCAFILDHPGLGCSSRALAVLA